MRDVKPFAGCDRDSCDFFTEGRFCEALDKAGVPRHQKWRTLILYMRGLADFSYLTESQKAAVQDLLVSVLRERDFSDDRFEEVLLRDREILVAPYEQRLRQALSEAGTLVEDFRRLLQQRKGVVKGLEQASVDAVLHGGDPETIVSVLRNTFREVENLLHADASSMNELLSRDFLTGIANRRAFDGHLLQCIDDWNEMRRPLALVMLDIDHFKTFNDVYGHRIGDQALQTVGQALASVATPSDAPAGSVFPARYGGEEFAVVLSGAVALRAADVAEEVRASLERNLFSIRDGDGNVLQRDLSITVSGGVAVVSPEWAPTTIRDNLVDAADDALYAAKDAGRNRIRVWPLPRG